MATDPREISQSADGEMIEKRGRFIAHQVILGASGALLKPTGNSQTFLGERVCFLFLFFFLIAAHTWREKRISHRI